MRMFYSLIKAIPQVISISFSSIFYNLLYIFHYFYKSDLALLTTHLHKPSGLVIFDNHIYYELELQYLSFRLIYFLFQYCKIMS